MWRSFGKTCFACAYSWSSTAGRFIRGAAEPTAFPFIVCYHRVVENFNRSSDGSIPSMLISSAMLERHIDWMAKRFTFLSLDEIGMQLESGRPFVKPAAAITFDDGYSDVYHHAHPLLMRKGIPAAVFVVTSLIGTGRPQIFDRCYLLLRLLYIHGAPVGDTVAGVLREQGFNAGPVEALGSWRNDPFRVMTAILNAMPQDQIEIVLAGLEEHFCVKRDQLEEITPLTWDMVRVMQRSGVTIGSHTMTHRLLPSETIETVRTELAGSKVALEQKLTTTVDHFAYPDGRFNPLVVKAVQSAGYRYGFGICSTRDSQLPLLTIPRKVLWERSCLNMLGRFSPAVMNCQAHWAFDRNMSCEHNHRAAYEVMKSGTVA